MEYDVHVFHSQEDNGYIADIPDLAFCSAFGTSPELALAEVQVAKAAWLKAAKASGRKVTEPSIVQRSIK